MGYWLKLYTDILDDQKYFRLSDNARLGMYEIFLVAKKIETDEITGELPDIEGIAFHTRRDEEWWNEVMPELIKSDIVEMKEDLPKVKNFYERQRPIPPAERTRQSRKRNNDNSFTDSNDVVTIRNGEKSREELDVEKEIEKDVDVNNATADLITTFITQTDLKPGKGAEEIANNLIQAGVISEDIIKAIDFLNDNDKLKCVRFASVEKSAIIERNRRIGRNKEDDPEDYRRYIKGEYGKFGDY